MSERLYKREKNQTCRNVSFITIGTSFLQSLKDKKYCDRSINTYRYPIQRFFSFLDEKKLSRNALSLISPLMN